MKKYLILGLLLLVSVGLVFAVKPDFTPKPANIPKGHATVSIPSDAAEVSPGVFYLGKAFDKGRVVEGYAIIKYKEKEIDRLNLDDVIDDWLESNDYVLVNE